MVICLVFYKTKGNLGILSRKALKLFGHKAVGIQSTKARKQAQKIIAADAKGSERKSNEASCGVSQELTGSCQLCPQQTKRMLFY
ncbi:Hypothetical predicted protein [Paramuricea clavata]|uniref:Uncharacterized protein n=1 Tax=Paramuricea clavata TaxID=317549 RepID=A0A7D9I9I4_PARCT|nr:Hypothetical predicted protein [Paramuricea clavata]